MSFEPIYVSRQLSREAQTGPKFVDQKKTTLGSEVKSDLIFRKPKDRSFRIYIGSYLVFYSFTSKFEAENRQFSKIYGYNILNFHQVQIRLETPKAILNVLSGVDVLILWFDIPVVEFLHPKMQLECFSS